MRDRLDLQKRLKSILAPLGIKNFYFEPPSSIKMTYPCCVLNREGLDAKKADDKAHITTWRYNFSLIAKDDDILVKTVAPLLELPYCSLSQTYMADDLHHYSFTIYF